MEGSQYRWFRHLIRVPPGTGCRVPQEELESVSVEGKVLDLLHDPITDKGQKMEIKEQSFWNFCQVSGEKSCGLEASDVGITVNIKDVPLKHSYCKS